MNDDRNEMSSAERLISPQLFTRKLVDVKVGNWQVFWLVPLFSTFPSLAGQWFED
jgi:hypothetical protein